MEFIKNLSDWEFLDEPLWRWFIFGFIAMPLIGFAWHSILDFMR